MGLPKVTQDASGRALNPGCYNIKLLFLHALNLINTCQWQLFCYLDICTVCGHQYLILYMILVSSHLQIYVRCSWKSSSLLTSMGLYVTYRSAQNLILWDLCVHIQGWNCTVNMRQAIVYFGFSISKMLPPASWKQVNATDNCNIDIQYFQMNYFKIGWTARIVGRNMNQETFEMSGNVGLLNHGSKCYWISLKYLGSNLTS